MSIAVTANNPKSVKSVTVKFDDFTLAALTGTSRSTLEENREKSYNPC
jgi:hypothetical protein